MVKLFLRVRDKVGVCKKSDSFNDKDSFEDNEVDTPKWKWKLQGKRNILKNGKWKFYWEFNESESGVSIH